MTDTRRLRPPLIQLVDELSSLTLVEASELVKALEDGLGVSSIAIAWVEPSSNSYPSMSICNPPEFEVTMRVRSFGPRRVETIKALIRLTGWSLSEVLQVERQPYHQHTNSVAAVRALQKAIDEVRLLGAEVEIDVD